MITIEMYYFNKKEIMGSIGGRADSINYRLHFTNENDGIGIDISVQGKENFKFLLKQINNVGNSLLKERE